MRSCFNCTRSSPVSDTRGDRGRDLKVPNRRVCSRARGSSCEIRFNISAAVWSSNRFWSKNSTFKIHFSFRHSGNSQRFDQIHLELFWGGGHPDPGSESGLLGCEDGGGNNSLGQPRWCLEPSAKRDSRTKVSSAANPPPPGDEPSGLDNMCSAPCQCRRA